MPIGNYGTTCVKANFPDFVTCVRFLLILTKLAVIGIIPKKAKTTPRFAVG
jgi:hypothetical protein